MQSRDAPKPDARPALEQLSVMVVLVGTYLALVEGVKRLLTPPPAVRTRKVAAGRRIHRRAARFTIRA